MRLIIWLSSLIIFTSFVIAQETLSAYEGEFQIRPGFNIIITSENGELFVEPTTKPKEKLVKVDEYHFMVESIQAEIDFSLLEQNDVVVVNMYGSILHSPRVPYDENFDSIEEIILPSADLEKYVGEYTITPKLDLIIALQDNELTAQMTDQPVFPIYPYSPDKFFYKVTPAYIEFVLDNNKAIKYLLLMQNGMIMQGNKK